MQEFERLIGKRHETVDGIGPWYWIASDTGAWDGPKMDWETSHSHKWFTSVPNYDVCVQAGACQGMYPRLLARKFKRVYSFEPDRLNFYVASLNCQNEDIHLFNGALGTESGTFTGMKRASMDNVGMHQTQGTGSIPIFSIDSFNLPTCGLIALDIEGYELYALQGARETIRRCSPVVVAEMPKPETLELLREYGYVEADKSVSDSVFIRA